MTALHTLFGASALSVIIGFTALHTVQAATESTQSLADDWAHTVFEQPKSTHKKQLAALHARARDALANSSNDPDLLAWSGIIAATYAGARGGLGALKVAKQAKADFEKAMAIDPEALDGGARSSLGTLYAKVPGWPIGFGSKKKAEALLSESAKRHPENLSAQYFYAEFLVDAKRDDEARAILERASVIPPRADHEVADSGRKKEVLALINVLDSR